MDEIDRPITFRQLLTRCSRIEVPLIQRDYAQGREAEKEVREGFLKALSGALFAAEGDAFQPLNLDFVYGSMENGQGDSFLPLDGQQRLTTLFLLHWYLAWHDDRHPDLKAMLWDGRHSRFTYGVRPSSSEFFDELVLYVPECVPDEVSSLKLHLEDQPWFFSRWRLDPTIQSSLVMLEEIHRLFRSHKGLFALLTDEGTPAITFQLLPLEHFGLTDDLYIKMNARGKPLTLFETFKARFEELLADMFPAETRELGGTEVSIAEFFERRIDTQWTDLFWAHRNAKASVFDDSAMNLLWALARISIDPTSAEFGRDMALLRDKQEAGTFALFHERGWLTPAFAGNLICLLEAWSREGGRLAPLLPDKGYFDELAAFQKSMQQPQAFDYSALTQFAAFVFYLRTHEHRVEPGSLNEWMRVVRNLTANSDIERPEDYGRCLTSLVKLMPKAPAILEHLAQGDVEFAGFSAQQVREEVLKARLFLAKPEWRGRIEDAENHPYFSGQIEFLLDFCGVLTEANKCELPEDWNDAVHMQSQSLFDQYLQKAKITFTASGLASAKGGEELHLWRRALLTCGDYLLESGWNSSFVTDSPANWDSWKRFLRGGGGAASKRAYLKTLWDKIDPMTEIDSQLNLIIESATGLESWRNAIVRYPEVMRYCGLQEIRREGGLGRIYLLKKRQMNGKHAELFTYALYCELEKLDDAPWLASLGDRYYQDVSMTEKEPSLVFSITLDTKRLKFVLISHVDKFCIAALRADVEALPGLASALCGEDGFSNGEHWLTRLISREEVQGALRSLAERLDSLRIKVANI